MKFEAIDAQRTEFPVAQLCRVLDVSRSGYYEWRRKTPDRDANSIRDQRLVRTIEAVHLGSKQRYGSPRVSNRIAGLGFDVSPSTVARRMKAHGIKSKLARKFKATTDSDHNLPVKPNLLMQDFTAYRPDQIWMSDITYVQTREVMFVRISDTRNLYSFTARDASANSFSNSIGVA